MDVLSDVLRAVRLTGAIYFDVDASSPWVGESPGTADIAAAIMPEAEHIISFHAVMSGSCWAALADDSVPPVLVNAGDVVVFPRGVPNVLSSSPGARGEPNMAMYYRPIDESLPFAVIHGGGGDERTLACAVRYFSCALSARNRRQSASQPFLNPAEIDRTQFRPCRDCDR
ncbi:cupin domain-containing protein [Mesorhizobium sp. M0142]|uniref:cupin domain-containing protein n=1 Tax=Mesorhizobium sp. M0142 TaxID=2956894 RepID=UPI00333CEE38